MTRNLLITGAGVDCTKGIGFPMAATLLPEIAAYIDAGGKPLDQTQRALILRVVDEIQIHSRPVIEHC